MSNSNHGYLVGADFAAEDEDTGTLWKLEGVKLWSIDVGWARRTRARTTAWSTAGPLRTSTSRQ